MSTTTQLEKREEKESIETMEDNSKIVENENRDQILKDLAQTSYVNIGNEEISELISKGSEDTGEVAEEEPIVEQKREEVIVDQPEEKDMTLPPTSIEVEDKETPLEQVSEDHHVSPVVESTPAVVETTAQVIEPTSTAANPETVNHNEPKKMSLMSKVKNFFKGKKRQRPTNQRPVSTEV